MNIPRPRAKRRKAEPTIALINVVFLMLIFFRVAGTVAPLLERDISLVNTESLEVRAPPDALVLMADGTLMFRGARTDAAAHMSITDGATVRIVPDRAVPAARLVEVTLALRAAGAMRVMSWYGMSPEVQVAGGGGAQIAVQGTSFADLTAGVSESVPVETRTAIVSQTQSQVVTQPTVISATVTPSVTATAIPTQPEVSSSTPTATAPLPAVAANMAPPVVASHTADNAVASVEETTPRISARPRERSAEIEKQAQARTRGKPTPQRTTVSKPRGTAKTNATRGAATGKKSGQATSSGAGAQKAAGNAAASNYPGQVQRRIARQRLPRVRAKGVARVSFSISGNGGLATLRLAGSSGSAELDREALRLIKRAAPFPAPPSGAQRLFTIPIRAR